MFLPSLYVGRTSDTSTRESALAAAITKGPLGHVCNEAIANISPSTQTLTLCGSASPKSLLSRSLLRLHYLRCVHVRSCGGEAKSVMRIQIAQKFAPKMIVRVSGFSFQIRRFPLEDDCRES